MRALRPITMVCQYLTVSEIIY